MRIKELQKKLQHLIDLGYGDLPIFIREENKNIVVLPITIRNKKIKAIDSYKALSDIDGFTIFDNILDRNI